MKSGKGTPADPKRPQYAPWPMEEQVVALYAGIHGFLDDVPVAQIPRFHDELREHVRTEGSILKDIREKEELTDELGKRLDEELQKFKKGFNVEQEEGLV